MRIYQFVLNKMGLRRHKNKLRKSNNLAEESKEKISIQSESQDLSMKSDIGFKNQTLSSRKVSSEDIIMKEKKWVNPKKKSKISRRINNISIKNVIAKFKSKSLIYNSCMDNTSANISSLSMSNESDNELCRACTVEQHNTNKELTKVSSALPAVALHFNGEFLERLERLQRDKLIICGLLLNGANTQSDLMDKPVNSYRQPPIVSKSRGDYSQQQLDYDLYFPSSFLHLSAQAKNKTYSICTYDIEYL